MVDTAINVVRESWIWDRCTGFAQQAAISALEGPQESVEIAGVPAADRPLRDALERAYRDLAALTPAGEERVSLVDRANTVRRWTLR